MNYELYYYHIGKLKEVKEVLSRQLRVEYKHLFRLMDIFFILIFVFNIGALTITNVMVMKETPAVELREVNPIQAKLQGYEVHPEAYSMVKSFLIQSVLYVISIMGYWMMRFSAFTKTQLIVCLAIVFFYSVTSAMDFFNDWGYLLGKWVYG
jgi:hypothetical protein